MLLCLLHPAAASLVSKTSLLASNTQNKPYLAGIRAFARCVLRRVWYECLDNAFCL
jgi:hypothetical protein